MVFLSRRCQNVENVHETFINSKIPFWKRTLFFDHRVRNVPQVSSETSLPWLVQNKPSVPIRRVENRVEFLEEQFHNEKLSFDHKKKLSILLNFFFPFVSFIGVFSISKRKTLVLKTTGWWTRAIYFVDGWHLLWCQIRFFLHPLNGWHDRWTFVGEWGMGRSSSNGASISYTGPWSQPFP